MLDIRVNYAPNFNLEKTKLRLTRRWLEKIAIYQACSSFFSDGLCSAWVPRQPELVRRTVEYNRLYSHLHLKLIKRLSQQLAGGVTTEALKGQMYCLKLTAP